MTPCEEFFSNLSRSSLRTGPGAGRSEAEGLAARATEALHPGRPGPHLRASDSPRLRNGYTFPQLARIPESEAPALVEAAIREILAESGA